MSDYKTNNEYLKTIAGDESNEYHKNNEYLKMIAENGTGGGAQILKPPVYSGKWKAKDFPNGHYMCVGNNHEYIGVCFFSIKRYNSESIEFHYFGFGDDSYIEGIDSNNTSFSKLIRATADSVFFNDNSTFWFTGDSFNGANDDTIYKLN